MQRRTESPVTHAAQHTRHYIGHSKSENDDQVCHWPPVRALLGCNDHCLCGGCVAIEHVCQRVLEQCSLLDPAACRPWRVQRRLETVGELACQKEGVNVTKKRGVHEVLTISVRATKI